MNFKKTVFTALVAACTVFSLNCSAQSCSDPAACNYDVDAVKQAATSHESPQADNLSDEGFWLGYSFTMNASKSVTALGVWNPEGCWNVFDWDTFEDVEVCLQGQERAAHVGIYNSAGELVADATIGGDIFVEGEYAYKSISPIILEAGETYTLLTATGNGVYFAGANSVSFDADVSQGSMFSTNLNSASTTLPASIPVNTNGWSFQYRTVNMLLEDSGDCDYGIEGVCEVLGCTYENATNFNPEANTDDGSCIFPVISGCTDEAALNYNPHATTDDGYCVFTTCRGDFDADGDLDTTDLLNFLTNFGLACNDN